MLTLKNCPVCNHDNFTPFISCKDHTVSAEVFNIVSCSGCNFKFTNPRPEDSIIGNYYKSEDYISHSNTKKGLISSLYHLVRSYTLGQKEKLLNKYVSRGTLLDYGCGTGMFLKKCRDRSWSVFGLEPDDGARSIAKSFDLKLCENLNELNQLVEDRSLSAITLWHVLEHVSDLDNTLNLFRRKLKEDGVLIIAVPNYCSYDAKHYKENWAAYDVPRHLYHFNLDSVSNLLKNFAFKLIDTKPMKFDSFYVSMLSERYKTGKQSLINSFLIGLRSNLRAKKASDYSSVIYVFKKA